MSDELCNQWKALGVTAAERFVEPEACTLWNRLTQFPVPDGADSGPVSPLVSLTIRPSQLIGAIRRLVKSTWRHWMRTVRWRANTWRRAPERGVNSPRLGYTR